MKFDWGFHQLDRKKPPNSENYKIASCLNFRNYVPFCVDPGYSEKSDHYTIFEFSEFGWGAAVRASRLRQLQNWAGLERPLFF